jgi:tetratricopeptide (TPR) repeat protein
VVPFSGPGALAKAHAWFRRSQRGRVLFGLFLLLLPGFALTAFTTRAYRSEQQRLAAESSHRGDSALRNGRPAEAIDELRTAMSLAPTRQRRLRLGQALAAAGRDAEARAHLLTLREDAPGDGVINLELARLAGRDGDVTSASHYYRNAIEGAWETAPEGNRRKVRLELAELLVRQGTPTQAEAELITLAADMPRDPALHVRVGDLLMQAQQAPRAFDVYTAALQIDPASRRALQGAGESAFRMANYVTARRYFEAVASAEPGNAHVRGRLDTITAVLTMDPFRRGLAARERARRVVLAFEIASARLEACSASLGIALPAAQVSTPAPEASNTDGLQRLATELRDTAPSVKVNTLLRDPDAMERVMDLVFRVEDACEARCGEAGHGSDQALVLIARGRRATER